MDGIFLCIDIEEPLTVEANLFGTFSDLLPFLVGFFHHVAIVVNLIHGLKVTNDALLVDLDVLPVGGGYLDGLNLDLILFGVLFAFGAGYTLGAALHHVLGEALLECETTVGVSLHVELLFPELFAVAKRLDLDRAVLSGDNHPLGIDTLAVLSNETVTLAACGQVHTIGAFDRDRAVHDSECFGQVRSLGLSEDGKRRVLITILKAPESLYFVIILRDLAIVENSPPIIFFLEPNPTVF